MMTDGVLSLQSLITVTAAIDSMALSESIMLTLYNPCSQSDMSRVIHPASLDPKHSIEYKVGAKAV